MRRMLLALVVGGMACAAAPPARMTPEQVKLLRERNAHWGVGQKAWNAGKQAEAIAALEKSLASQVRVWGPLDRTTDTIAERLGDWHQGRGEWAREAKYRRMVLAARRALFGEGHYRTVDAQWELRTTDLRTGWTRQQALQWDEASRLNAEVFRLWQQGQSTRALPLARKALAVRRSLAGEKHPAVAMSLFNLAAQHLALGEHKAALPLLQKALQITKDALGEKHPDYATSLNGLAALYKSMGEHKAALPLFLKALQIRKEVLGEKHPNYAQSLNNLALLYQEIGEYKAALPLYQKALQIKKEALGEKHPDYATSLNNLALLYQHMGEHKAALPLYHKALQIYKEALGEKHPHYATSLHNLAYLYQKMGDHKAALPLFKKSLEIKKEALGEKHHNYATSLHSLAVQYESMGDHKAALPLFNKALEITKEVQGEKHPAYATNVNDLAALYQSMGEYKAALPLYQKALKVYKEALGEKHPSYATCLNGLAALYWSMGEHKAALPLYNKALQINKEALGEKHPHHAASLNNLAALYESMGDHEAALPLSKQALEIAKEALGERHPHYANGLHNLALLYHKMGEHKTALPLFLKSLQVGKEVLGEKHPLYATCMTDLARLYHAMKNHKAALPLSEAAILLTLSQLRASAAVQSDRQQFAAAEAFRHHLDARLSFAGDRVYAHVLAWKGAVLLRQRQRRLFSALSASPKTRQAARQLQAATRQIAVLSASAKPAREQLERLTKEQERLQAQLSELSVEAQTAFQAETITPKALSAALPEGTVLVDYHFYWCDGITYRDGRPNWVRHLAAFVSRRGKPTVRVDLGPAEKAESAIRQWRTSLLRGQSGRSLGAELKKLVWSPLEKHLSGAKAVLVSPDEALVGVPFCALPGKKAGSYLIEDVALAVVPVPQLLPEMLKPQDKSKRLGPSLLVVGAVDYDRAGAVARADKAGDRGAPLGIRRDWGRLPGTFAEAAAVSKSFSGLFDGGSVTDLGNSKATKARVRQALQKVRYAHLATHGFFAAEDIKSAAESKQKPDAFFGRGGVTGWHPLLLSGVVLAGANKEPKPGEEDGILTALEVSEMELPKLELVVLSACETGLGKTAGGEGLLGLQRAFQVAGARTVIASLWAVDDRATQALMAEFCKAAWNEKSPVSKAEALRRAQQAVMHGTVKDGKFRGPGKVPGKLPAGEKASPRLPPLYWGAFVLSGDWR